MSEPLFFNGRAHGAAVLFQWSRIGHSSWVCAPLVRASTPFCASTCWDNPHRLYPSADRDGCILPSWTAPSNSGCRLQLSHKARTFLSSWDSRRMLWPMDDRDGCTWSSSLPSMWVSLHGSWLHLPFALCFLVGEPMRRCDVCATSCTVDARSNRCVTYGEHKHHPLPWKRHRHLIRNIAIKSNRDLDTTSMSLIQVVARGKMARSCRLPQVEATWKAS